MCETVWDFEKIKVPKGSMNLIIALAGSTETGSRKSKDVDMVTFTGSAEVGQSIMRAAGRQCKKDRP